MTRKEEIINYANSFKGNGMENEELKAIIRLAIIDGAIWADANPNMDAFIEKAVQKNVDVKTVDFEKELGKYLDANDIESINQVKLLDFAKYFFKLGLKAAQKGE